MSVTIGRRFSRVRATEYPDGALLTEIDRDLRATREQMRSRAVRVLEDAGVPVVELLGKAQAGPLLRDYVLNALELPADSELGLSARIVELCNTLDAIESMGGPMREVIRLALLLGRLDMLARVYRAQAATTAPALRKGSEARRRYTDDDRARWATRWDELRTMNRRMSASAAAERIAADFGHDRAAARTIRHHLATLGKK